MSETRYSVGIDLGTTNSVVAYVDLSGCDGEKAPLEILEIPQLTAPGTIGDRKQLPSFMYQAHEAELAPGDIVLPGMSVPKPSPVSWPANSAPRPRSGWSPAPRVGCATVA